MPADRDSVHTPVAAAGQHPANTPQHNAGCLFKSKLHPNQAQAGMPGAATAFPVLISPTGALCGSCPALSTATESSRRSLRVRAPKMSACWSRFCSVACRRCCRADALDAASCMPCLSSRRLFSSKASACRQASTCSVSDIPAAEDSYNTVSAEKAATFKCAWLAMPQMMIICCWRSQWCHITADVYGRY